MGITERKQREVERMRARILKASMELFAKGGTENVTMRNIARKIEYSPGTIYRYFENKNSILEQLCFEGFELFLARFERHNSIEDPYDRLQTLARDYIDFAKSFPDYYHLMFFTSDVFLTPDPEGHHAPRKCYNNFLHIVRECMAKGYIGEGHDETVAISIWGSVHGLASLLIKGQLRMFPGQDHEKVIEDCLQFALR